MTRKEHKRKSALLARCLKYEYWGGYARNLIKDLLEYTSRCKPVK